MGHADASRKSPNDAPWEKLSLRLSRPISASLLTGHLRGTCPSSDSCSVMEVRRRKALSKTSFRFCHPKLYPLVGLYLINQSNLIFAPLGKNAVAGLAVINWQCANGEIYGVVSDPYGFIDWGSDSRWSFTTFAEVISTFDYL